MKKILLTVLALVVCCFLGAAQKTRGSLRGVLLDSLSSTPLAGATVSLVRLPDSTLLSFTLTETGGRFEVRNLEPGSYRLVAAFSGMKTWADSFSISASQPLKDLGFIRMERFYKTMQEVIINEAPVKVSGDTIAYRADAFKTRPGATVEDLLKKLPGVQVGRDGNVKNQGEDIQKIYVDGKEFFSNDPKLATRNLTADMIDQVEVFDDMSEQAKFNKIDDGSRSRAINLKLKKDKKKGVFGKAYGGYGTEDRFDAGANANFFQGATQASVVARTNNTNNLGFSFSDMIGMFGSGGLGAQTAGMGMSVVKTGGGGFGGLNLGSGGGGITRSSQLGLNYRDTWSRLFEFNGSYFMNHVGTDNAVNALTTSLGKDSTLLTHDHTLSGAENDNHHFNGNLVWTIDSFNSIIYHPGLSYQKSYQVYSLDSFYIEAQQQDHGYRINEGSTLNRSSGEGYSWSDNLIWRKRFRKPGRTLSLSLSNTKGHSLRDVHTNTHSTYYNPDGLPWRVEDLQKAYHTESGTDNKAILLSYTEPLAPDKLLELNYGHTDNRSQSDRQTQDFNSVSGKFEDVDSLRNNFQNRDQWDRLGANLRMVRKKFNYQLGFAVQKTRLENENLVGQTLLRQDATNLFPTASFAYQFARSRNLRFSYRGSTRQPSTAQLQDIVDSSNYHNLYQGNPLLKQEFSQNLTLSYNAFDVVRFRNLFAFVTFSQTRNRIANAVRQLPGGASFTRPVNLNGAFNLNGTFNLGFPIQMLKGGNINTNTRISYNRDVNLVDGNSNFTNQINMGEDLRLNYSYQEALDLGLVLGTNYTAVTYTVQPEQNTHFFTHTVSVDGSYTLPGAWVLSTDLDYTLNTGRINGFNQAAALWNGSLAKEMLKNRRGELRLAVFDILGQNRSLSRNIGSNYIADVESSVLKRFFLLSFSYKLSRLGGRTMPPMMEKATRGLRIVQ